MTDEIPIERLILYEETGSQVETLEISRGDFLMKLGSITDSQLRSDLRALGVRFDNQIPVRDLLISVRRRLQSHLENYVEPSVKTLVQVSAQDLERAFAESQRSPEEIYAKELAVTMAQEFSDRFLLSLARMRHPYYPFDHQILSTRDVVERMHGCGILADEVGLGKTVTGILIVLELFLRHLAETVLVLVPANLLDQWKKEWARFFLVQPDVLEGPKDKDLDRAANASYLLASMHKAKNEEFSKILLKRYWDCILIDEGHYLRNDDTKLYRFCYGLQGTFRILLTATPVHNDAFDLYNQATYIRPGFLGSRSQFRELHLDESGNVIEPAILRKRLASVVSRTRRDDTEAEFAERDMEPLTIERTNFEKGLYEQVLSIIRGSYRRYLRGTVSIKRLGDFETHVSSLVIVAMLLLRRLGSHPCAGLRTLDTALRRHLEKRAELFGDDAEIARLDDLVKQYREEVWTAGTHAKTDELLKRLPDLMGEESGFRTKCIVYTQFLPTLRVLKRLVMDHMEEMQSEPFRIFVLEGSLRRRLKDYIVESFQECQMPSLLLSSDCGSEGLNLQSASVVVNFDFPWNPMRIEQRIGRIDRYGQEHPEISIVDFLTKGTIEEYVYRVLLKKLELFKDMMGDFVPPISPLALDTFFDRRIGRIIVESRNDEEMEKRFSQFVTNCKQELQSSLHGDYQIWGRSDE